MRRITRLTNSAAQTIPDSADTTLTFDTAVIAIPARSYDAGAASKITVKQRGTYAGKLRVKFDVSVDGLRHLKIVKNGSVVVGHAIVWPVDGVEFPAECSFDAEDCVAGDYFQAVVKQDTGDDLDVLGGGGQDDFPGFYLWRIDT